MYKSVVYRHYKTYTAIAKALGITRAAVSQWPAIVPEGMAYKLAAITKGKKLQINPKHYGKKAA